MKKPNLPYVSVVITVFNTAHVVGRAIESVMAQDYPKDRFEIICVDDGSTDHSVEVVERYPVRFVRHIENMGVAAARDTGLSLCEGDIYVCLDDDCVVPPNWLRALVAGYDMPDVLGAGSVLEPPHKVYGLVDRFMAAAAAGRHVPISMGAHRGPLARLLAYLEDQLAPEEQCRTCAPYPVRQLNGASASFPVSVLRAVGGWDRSLHWMEDTDLCERIVKKFPNGHFYAVPDAKIIHDPKMGLVRFIKRPYRRGLDNLMFYRRNDLVPPIFPSPIIWAGCVLASLTRGPLVTALAVAVLPQLLYVWWPLRVRRDGLWSLTFAYLQLGEELSTVAGLIRGAFILALRRTNAEQA